MALSGFYFELFPHSKLKYKTKNNNNCYQALALQVNILLDLT